MEWTMMMNVFKSNKSKLIGLIALFILLFLVFIVSISVGQTPITVITTIQAFIQYDPSNTEHIIIMTSRSKNDTNYNRWN